MDEIRNLRTRLDQQIGRKQQIEHSITETESAIRDRKRSLRRHEQAREIIREVGLKTQQQLQVHISDITTLALDAIFDDPYKLVVEFIQRRNKTECDLLFERDEQKISPLSASGGGPVDVAAFALRVASWSMQNPRSRNTFLLDEPFRFPSANLLPRVGEMLNQISKEMNLQIIMITHREELAEMADRIFQVGIKKGKSIVEVE
jgi:DNA repair exonuclease SbcCD ATPase subunit